MSDESEPQGEAREHDRRVVSFAVQMSVALRTVDAEDPPFEAQGRTINLSRTGMLARVDRHLPIERNCVVDFPDAVHKLARTRVRGVVVRCDPMEEDVAIAVEFETPLEFVRSSED